MDSGTISIHRAACVAAVSTPVFNPLLDASFLPDAAFFTAAHASKRSAPTASTAYYLRGTDFSIIPAGEAAPKLLMDAQRRGAARVGAHAMQRIFGTKTPGPL
ncbi:MAG: hypothetical protein ACJ8FY_01115 [Gemmataceae bacterium]